jgi:hypothetical protein
MVGDIVGYTAMTLIAALFIGAGYVVAFNVRGIAARMHEARRRRIGRFAGPYSFMIGAGALTMVVGVLIAVFLIYTLVHAASK